MNRKTEYELYLFIKRGEDIMEYYKQKKEIASSMRNGHKSYEHYETKAERRGSVMRNQGFGDAFIRTRVNGVVIEIDIKQAALTKTGRYKKALQRAMAVLPDVEAFNDMMSGKAFAKEVK